jgi:hypothetical protein
MYYFMLLEVLGRVGRRFKKGIWREGREISLVMKERRKHVLWMVIQTLTIQDTNYK